MSEGKGKGSRVGRDSAGDIGCLSDEILAKILSGLPIKSVLKCKSVVKTWNRLIVEPKFAQLQFSSSRQSQKYILYFSDDDSTAGIDLYVIDKDRKVSQYITLPNLDQNFSLKWICSFNGLLCFTKLAGTMGLDILVCNPATREVLELPSGSPSTVDPSIGIIFDPDRNKYKVLRFFSDTPESEDGSCKCEIYTPDGGNWREIAGVVQPPAVNSACPSFPTHVCVGGKMYWLVWSEEDRDAPGHILSIDMDDNITRINLPGVPEQPEDDYDSPNEFNLYTFLIQYEGCLALVSVGNDETFLCIWSLMDDSSWFYEGGAELHFDGNIDGINSIVSIEKEVLFVIRPAFDRYYHFHFLNMIDMTWSTPSADSISERCGFVKRKLETATGYGPIVFPFVESLFRCDMSN